jgi:putative oxidoreductase
MDTGLLIGRLVVGLLMAAHGSQKLFGWFGGHGLAGTGGFLTSLGFRPGRLFAVLAGAGELAGGLLIALGLFGPVGPAIVLALMIVAAISVHWRHGLFTMTNGIELPLLYAGGGTALALTGPGRHSLDALVGLTPWTSAPAWAAIAAAVLIGAASLALRRPVPAAA